MDGRKSIVWHTVPVDVMRRCFADASPSTMQLNFARKGEIAARAENSPTAFSGSGIDEQLPSQNRFRCKNIKNFKVSFCKISICVGK